MASLTSLLNFGNEHQGIGIAQDQGIAGYLYNGLGLLDLVFVPPPTQPKFQGPKLDLVLIMRNEIWREVQ